MSEAGLSIERKDDHTAFIFSGRLSSDSVGPLWRRAIREAARAKAGKLIFDLRGVIACDMGGAAFLAAAEVAYGQPAELVSANRQVTALLERARVASGGRANESAAGPTMLDALREAMRLLLGSVAFIGEAFVATLRIPARRRMLRLADVLRYADQAGVRSMPLVLLMGYLIGLILAFQSAVPMRRFGADIFVANLVAISLFRELGPLLAAVILAGRTGSAFAAEIGTMKVNEEVDALVTMGLDPMTMLVLPRIMAAMLVMPAMTLAMELSGLAGMTTVMRGFGFPMAAITRQVQVWVTAADMFGGLFKAVCFGLAVAAIGCRAGLATGVGPRAVGLSATAAVVGGIVATIALDGVFALIFYRLHW